MSTTSLETFYGSFGPEITALVRTELNRHGTLEPLLQRLGTRVPAGMDNQHKALQYFLYQYGVSFFLHVLNSNMTPDEIEVEKVRRLMPRSATSGKSQTLPDSHAADSSAVRRAPNAAQHTSPAPQVQNQGGAAGNAPAYSGQDRRGAPPYVGPDRRGAAGYAGQERRRGIERRVGPADRRAELDVVYKNRRFGGRDRRKEIRRTEDREKAAKK